jgi:hypothetical protein
LQNRLTGFTLGFLEVVQESVVIQLDCKFTQIDSFNRQNFKWLSQFLRLLHSAAMNATLPPATPLQTLRPPPRTSNDLRMLFSEAEQEKLLQRNVIVNWLNPGSISIFYA